MIRKLLDIDPAHRITATELASHWWTRGSDDASAGNTTNVLDMMRDFLIETKVSAWRQRCRWVFPVTCLTQGICLGRFTWWRWRDLWRHRRGNSRCFVFKHTMRWLVFVFLLSLFFRTYSNHLWLLQPLVTVACFASDIPEKTTRFPEKRSCRNRKFLGMRRIFCRNFLQTFPKNIYAKIFLHHNFCTCWQGWLI